MVRGGLKFKLGANLWEQDKFRVLVMAEQNFDRFAVSLEDTEPNTSEQMCTDLNSDNPIFRPLHKLGQVRKFVEAQC